MNVFEFSFGVNAPLSAVTAFHHDTRALKKLNPPGIVVQLHRVDPLGEGSISEFTLRFGPWPVRWVALHSEVSVNGFTDTQTSGPLKFWRHTHRFVATSPTTTEAHEYIEYEYHSGWRGALSRLLFNPLALRFLFFYRRLATTWATAN